MNPDAYNLHTVMKDGVFNEKTDKNIEYKKTRIHQGWVESLLTNKSETMIQILGVRPSKTNLIVQVKQKKGKMRAFLMYNIQF